MTSTAAPAPATSRHWRAALALIWRVGPAHTVAIVAATVLTGTVPALVVMCTTWAVQAVADSLTGGGSGWLLAARAVLALVLVTALGQGVSVVRRYLETLMQYRLANAVQLMIMDKAIGLELADFENPEVYDRIQRANREAAYRPFQIFSTVVSALSGLVTLVGLASVLIGWSVLVAVIVIASALPAMIGNLIFSRISWRLEYERSSDRRRLTYLQYLVTTDRTFKETKLFELGPMFRHRFTDVVEGFYAVDRSLERRQAWTNAALGLVGVLATGGAMLVAAGQSLESGQIGQFAGYLAAIGVAQSAAQVLVGDLADLYEHHLFLGNLFAFLALPATVLASGDRKLPAQLASGIEFRDVSFGYPGTDRQVIKNLDLTIPAGSCLALVGHNGSGKSTLIKLLARFYAPDSGQILIDGVPIEEYDLTDLRRHLGVIFQDFVQYEASARENIGFSQVSQLDDDTAIMAAAHQAGAAEFLRDLPSGLSSQLGRWFEEGHQLSGGQWQRIALARAFFRRPAVMVLDEPTASIDAAAEAEIFGRLQELTRGSTTVLIAHRFATVRSADLIVVLDDGRIVERGDHAELMNLDGRYAHLFRLQAAGYLDDPVVTADV